jgi:hypothetical protein
VRQGLRVQTSKAGKRFGAHIGVGVVRKTLEDGDVYLATQREKTDQICGRRSNARIRVRLGGHDIIDFADLRKGRERIYSDLRPGIARSSTCRLENPPVPAKRLAEIGKSRPYRTLLHHLREKRRRLLKLRFHWQMCESLELGDCGLAQGRRVETACELIHSTTCTPDHAERGEPHLDVIGLVVQHLPYGRAILSAGQALECNDPLLDAAAPVRQDIIPVIHGSGESMGGRNRNQVPWTATAVIRSAIVSMARRLPSAGSVERMAKDKVTITLDRSKANDARSLVGASSISEVIEIALERLIRAERKRRDVAAYGRLPLTKQEDDLALLREAGSALTDETDWESLYADVEG